MLGSRLWLLSNPREMNIYMHLELNVRILRTAHQAADAGFPASPSQETGAGFPAPGAGNLALDLGVHVVNMKPFIYSAFNVCLCLYT